MVGIRDRVTKKSDVRMDDLGDEDAFVPCELCDTMVRFSEYMSHASTCPGSDPRPPPIPMIHLPPLTFPTSMQNVLNVRLEDDEVGLVNIPIPTGLLQTLLERRLAARRQQDQENQEPPPPGSAQGTAQESAQESAQGAAQSNATPAPAPILNIRLSSFYRPILSHPIQSHADSNADSNADSQGDAANIPLAFNQSMFHFLHEEDTGEEADDEEADGEEADDEEADDTYNIDQDHAEDAAAADSLEDTTMDVRPDNDVFLERDQDVYHQQRRLRRRLHVRNTHRLAAAEGRNEIEAQGESMMDPFEQFFRQHGFRLPRMQWNIEMIPVVQPNTAPETLMSAIQTLLQRTPQLNAMGDVNDGSDYDFNLWISELIGNVNPPGVRNVEAVYTDVDLENVRIEPDEICAICRESLERTLHEAGEEIGNATEENGTEEQGDTVQPTRVPLAKLVCQHLFCKDCIVPWLQRNKHCPLCMCDLDDLVTPVSASNENLI